MVLDQKEDLGLKAALLLSPNHETEPSFLTVTLKFVEQKDMPIKRQPSETELCRPKSLSRHSQSLRGAHSWWQRDQIMLFSRSRLRLKIAQRNLLSRDTYRPNAAPESNIAWGV